MFFVLLKEISLAPMNLNYAVNFAYTRDLQDYFVSILWPNPVTIWILNQASYSYILIVYLKKYICKEETAKSILLLLFMMRYILLLYLMLVSCNLNGQLNGWHFWMSHGFYKGYRRKGDIQKMSHARMYARTFRTEKPMAAVAAYLATS